MVLWRHGQLLLIGSILVEMLLYILVWGLSYNNNSMDTQDNKYIRFKWISPFCYLTVFLSMAFGPYLFPIIFWRMCGITVLFGVFRLAYMFVCGLMALYRSVTLKDIEPTENPTDYHYGWIIPNYMESVEVISNTLQQLASHSRSKNNYIVCLAMEAHEAGSLQKAKLLCAKFSEYFKCLTFTVHKLKPTEVRGKASNVSYSVQQFESILPSWVNFEKLFLTIMDCDSMCPKEYPDQVNKHLYQNPQSIHQVVFNPTQIFKRNDMDVPVFTRSFDNYHSFAHWNNTVSLFNISSPFSNYTLSYKLIKSVGFWNKSGQALGEDMHTFCRIFWKTQEKVQSIPIYTPFNQLNLQSPDSYISNVKDKWYQVLRHAYGIHQVSYNVYQLVMSKTKTLRSFAMVFYIFEILLLHNCLTGPMGIYMEAVTFFNMNTEYPPLKSSITLHGWLKIICITLNFLCLLTFEVCKRYSNKRYYKKENESWLRFFECVIFMTVGIAGFIFPTFLIASFRGFFKNLEYKVANKVPKSLANTFKVQ